MRSAEAACFYLHRIGEGTQFLRASAPHRPLGHAHPVALSRIPAVHQYPLAAHGLHQRGRCALFRAGQSRVGPSPRGRRRPGRARGRGSAGGLARGLGWKYLARLLRAQDSRPATIAREFVHATLRDSAGAVQAERDTGDHRRQPAALLRADGQEPVSGLQGRWPR